MFYFISKETIVILNIIGKLEVSADTVLEEKTIMVYFVIYF